MIFLAQLALRNLFRNVNRTFITSITVVFGVALPILGWGMVDGLDVNTLRAARSTTVGDVLLRPDGYPTDGLEYPLADAAPLGALAGKLDAVAPDAWAARTVFPSRLVKGVESVRAQGIAYDAATDARVFPRDEWALEGAWPAVGATEIVLGQGLARLLDAKVGDDLVVEARTFPGALNALTFRVAGVVNTDSGATDNLGFWMELGIAEQLLQLDGRRTHVALRADAPERVAADLGGLGWSVRTLAEECADILAANMIRRYALLFLVGIIFLIAGVGIANTVIMAAYERVREIGTLVALGMKKRDVGALFLLEGAGMGLVAGLLGVALGAAGVLYWQANGIYLGEAVKQAGNVAMGATLYMQFRWPPILVSFGFGLGIAIFASLWPARYAANLNPADAVKAD